MQAMSGCAGFLSLSLPSDLLNKDPLRPIMPAWVNRPFNRTVASGPFGPDCAVKQPKKMPACNQATRSEEHTSELQSLMRISYAVFCLKQKKTTRNERQKHTNTN